VAQARQGECEAAAPEALSCTTRQPGLGHHLEEETTVAIDGQIDETAYFQPIHPGCEIFFIPKLEGG
jgi:hypothetical protein